jgi:DNA-directed RNA polymerase-3 subunit RPC5
MKPHRNLLEVDLGLDTECSNFDPDSRLSAPTRTLKSHAVPAKANYAVGALRGNELHLTPLHAALQMRPSFKLVDELDEKDREANGQAKEDPRARAAARKAEASSGAPDVYKVTIKRAETERTIERRQRSHAFLEREQQKEPWVDVELNCIDTEGAAQERDKLFAVNSDTPTLPLPLPTQDYLDLLSPPVSAPEAGSAADADSSKSDALQAVGPGRDLSMHSLRQMNLAEQTSALLRHTGVLRFDRLVTVLQTEPDQEEALIEALEREATLVQGCWVVKSSLVCSQDKDLAYREKLCLALVQDEFVSHTKFCEATDLNQFAAMKLFDSLTVKEPGRGCRLKVASDSSFCANYPEIVESHRVAWLARADEINGRFGSTS